MVNKKRREKIWVVTYAEVRRHSRTLYIPIDKMTERIHDIKKGDTLKVFLVEVIRSDHDAENT